MSEALRALTEHRNKIVTELRTIADEAGSGEFNTEQQSKWDSVNKDLSRVDSRIKDVSTAVESQRAAEAALEEHMREHPGTSEKDVQAAKNDGFRRMILGESRGHSVDPNTEGRNLLLEKRTHSKLTAGAGLNTVPTSFYGRLIEHLIENAAILRSGATVLNSDSGEVLQIPITTAHQTASLVAETATISTSDAVFGQRELGAYKYGYTFDVSHELLRDTGVDLEGYFARHAGQALGNAFGAHAINGTGSAQPRGVLMDTTTGATGPAAAGGGFGDQSNPGEGGDLLIELYHSVIEPYRRRSTVAWMMNDQTAAAVRKLKNSDGNYIWQASLTAGQPDMILGKPVVIDPNMPDLGTEVDGAIVFGDFSAYFARLVGSVRFERSDDFKFTNDLVSFRALYRADGTMVDRTGALKHFTGGPATAP